MAERKHNTLVALGSAAVFSIYSAGFYRTRAAANHIAESERTGRHDTSDVRAASLEHDVASVPLSLPSDTVQTSKNAPSKIGASPVPIATSPTMPATNPATQVAETPTEPAPAAVVQPPKAVAPAPVPQPPVDSAPKAEAAPKWRDGTYSGWGTSRHGDIEATVEIRGGRIVSAVISNCQTRYPCSRIDAIVPQVVTRQSAEVDYVSGATQSSDAFYYGVVEALKKAK